MLSYHFISQTRNNTNEAMKIKNYANKKIDANGVIWKVAKCNELKRVIYENGKIKFQIDGMWIEIPIKSAIDERENHMLDYHLYHIMSVLNNYIEGKEL